MYEDERVLLVGGGGREHAIARAVAQSDATLYACASNRNPGISALAADVETLTETDADAVVAYAREVDATLAIVGPEAPLAEGVSDALDDAGIYAFAPNAAEARIETDKSFQRTFLEEHDIPGNPDFETFDDIEAACAYIDEYDGDLAVKPAGLTGGKGVRVIGDQVTAAEAKTYLRESDYDRVVLEERLVGEEFTIQAFVADGDLRVTPAVQDHKRAYEGDEGPNTGGMGSYSAPTRELPFMTSDEYDTAVDIMTSVVEALPEYKGVLYGQFMLTAEGPKIVEFNARFGDPEAMNTLPILATPLLDIATAARDGEQLPQLAFSAHATVCKYAVPAGYPTEPEAGAKVQVDEAVIDRMNERHGRNGGDENVAADGGTPRVELFYASVDAREDGIYTTTSRSFAVVGIADSIAEAEAIVDETLTAAGTEGLRIRHDIGTTPLVESRVEHMRDLRN